MGKKMRIRQALFFPVLIPSIVCLTTVVRADTASEAALLYEQGTQLYSQKRYSEALEKLIASYRLAPNGPTANDIARIYKWQG